MTFPLQHSPLVLILVLFACASPTVGGEQATVEDDQNTAIVAPPEDEGGTPAAVSEAFAAKYPGEPSPEWRRDRNDSYEAHFKQDGERLRADFTPAGVWIETERSIKWDDLPGAVQDAIKAEYKKDDIVELEYTDNAERGEFYDVELDPKGEKKFDVEYREDGSKVK